MRSSWAKWNGVFTCLHRWWGSFTGFVFVFESTIWHHKNQWNWNCTAGCAWRWACFCFDMASRRTHCKNATWDLNQLRSKLISFAINFQSGIYRSSTNAYKKYLSTRPPASADSNKRVKSINFTALPALHDFNEYLYGDKADEKKDAMHVSLLSKMQKYRPSGVSDGGEFSIWMGPNLLRVFFPDHFRIEYTSKFGPMWGHEK